MSRTCCKTDTDTMPCVYCSLYSCTTDEIKTHLNVSTIEGIEGVTVKHYYIRDIRNGQYTILYLENETL